MILTGGYTNYGESIGILMLDTRFPRPIGDIGNALTFDFPVKYVKMIDVSPHRVVLDGDRTLLDVVLAAAHKLEEEGVRAITTSCGFLVLFQKKIAASLSVPFFSSSLLQIPLAYQLVGEQGKVGVLTISSSSLTVEHFRGAGAEHIPVVVEGFDGDTEFQRVFLDSSLNKDRYAYSADMEQCRQEIEQVALRLINKDKHIRAIVMECTNMPSFRTAVQSVTCLPVFDIVTLTRYVHSLVI